MSKSKRKTKSKPNPLDRIVGWGDSNTDFNVIPDEDLTDEELEVKYNHPVYLEHIRKRELDDSKP